ncbi:MAG: hypothetical protein OCD00_08490 [Colwellia sp.]
MWIIVAIILSFLGGVFLYLSNKHQRFLSKPLTKYWRIVGYLMMAFAFIAWWQTHAVSASIFLWLFTLSVVLMCIPLLSLLIGFNKHKGDSKWQG